MAAVALVVAILALLWAFLLWLRILPFTRGFRVVEQWMWDREIRRLEKFLDDEGER